MIECLLSISKAAAGGCLAVDSRALAQKYMGSRASARDMLHTFIAQRTRIDVFQEMLTRTQQDGRDHEVQLVNESRPQILPNRRHAAAESDVAPAGSRSS